MQKGDVTVTTMNAAAARRRHPRVALPILFALTGLGLAGCEFELVAVQRLQPAGLVDA